MILTLACTLRGRRQGLGELGNVPGVGHRRQPTEDAAGVAAPAVPRDAGPAAGVAHRGGPAGAQLDTSRTEARPAHRRLLVPGRQCLVEAMA